MDTHAFLHNIEADGHLKKIGLDISATCGAGLPQAEAVLPCPFLYQRPETFDTIRQRKI